MKSSSHSALGMIQQKMTGGPLNLKSSIISTSTNKSGKINDEGYATSDRQAKFRKPQGVQPVRNNRASSAHDGGTYLNMNMSPYR